MCPTSLRKVWLNPAQLEWRAGKCSESRRSGGPRRGGTKGTVRIGDKGEGRTTRPSTSCKPALLKGRHDTDSNGSKLRQRFVWHTGPPPLDANRFQTTGGAESYPGEREPCRAPRDNRGGKTGRTRHRRAIICEVKGEDDGVFDDVRTDERPRSMRRGCRAQRALERCTRLRLMRFHRTIARARARSGGEVYFIQRSSRC